MFILFGMTSCHWFDMEEEYINQRTVLVYMAGDNNLSYPSKNYAQEDLDEMIMAAGEIPNNCRLIIYVDDQDTPRILTVEQQAGRRPIAKVLHQYTEEHNSGDTETLRTALKWTINNHPAKSYGLVLWSHGDAWIPRKSPAQRAVCIDSKSGSWMNIADIASTLEEFPPMDFILFDACFMQTAEVAYELRHATRYIIASPAEIPGPGAPYHRTIAPMFSFPLDAEGIIDAYYREYYENDIFVSNTEYIFGVCLSVVDCAQFDQLTTTTAGMIKKYVSEGSNINLSDAQCYFPKTSRSYPEFYDMNGYMLRLITDEDDYAAWKEAYDHAVPYRRTTSQWYSDYCGGLLDIDIENYGGLSCYVPKRASSHTKWNEAFQSTSWYHATGWKVWYPATESSED